MIKELIVLFSIIILPIIGGMHLCFMTFCYLTSKDDLIKKLYRPFIINLELKYMSDYVFGSMLSGILLIPVLNISSVFMLIILCIIILMKILRIKIAEKKKMNTKDIDNGLW